MTAIRFQPTPPHPYHLSSSDFQMFEHSKPQAASSDSLALNSDGRLTAAPPVTEADAMLSGLLDFCGGGVTALAIEAARAAYEEHLLERPSNMPNLTTKQLNSSWQPAAGGPLDLLRSKKKTEETASARLAQNGFSTGVRRGAIRF
jgi:hypothetical protein